MLAGAAVPHIIMVPVVLAEQVVEVTGLEGLLLRPEAE